MAKQFTIPTVFSAIDKFTGPVQKMEKSVSRMAKGTDAAFDRMDRKFRRTAGQMNKVGSKMMVAGGLIAAPLALGVREAIKFEEKMANVSTLIDTNTESLEDMGDKVLKMATKLPVPIEELTTSLYDIRSAGIAANDQFSVLEATTKLSVAGLSSVSEATNLTTSAINAFASEGLTANEITNMLFKTVKFGKTTVAELSQAFGSVAPIIQSSSTTLKEFQAATAALTTTGTPAAQAQNQLKAAVIALQKPTKDMQAVFKKLGVTTEKELIKKFGGLVPAMQAVNKTTNELGINNAKAWSSTEALASVTSLTGATYESYQQTLKAMTNGVDDLGIAFDKQSKTGKAQMQVLKNQVQVLGIQIGQALLPVLLELMKTVGPMVQSFSKWVKNNKVLFASIVKVVAVVGSLSFGLGGLLKIAAPFVRIMPKMAKGFSVFSKTKIGAKGVGLLAKGLKMLPGPIGLAVAGVGALATVLFTLGKSEKNVFDKTKALSEIQSRAYQNSAKQRVEVTKLFMQLRALNPESEKYHQVLQQIDAMQPGLIEKYNLQAGALKNINAAEKELMKNIMARAKAQAVEDLYTESLTAVLDLETRKKMGEDVDSDELLLQKKKLSEFSTQFGIQQGLTENQARLESLRQGVELTKEFQDPATVIQSEKKYDQNGLPVYDVQNPTSSMNQNLNQNLEVDIKFDASGLPVINATSSGDATIKTNVSSTAGVNSILDDINNMK
jgi:TP901 family phage tail tape measure protein